MAAGEMMADVLLPRCIDFLLRVDATLLSAC